MDIIKTENTQDELSRYEEVLMRRDNLRKEAEQMQMSYFIEFGDLIVRFYEVRIECIRKKKEIAYCQQNANYGRLIDGDKLDSFIKGEMQQYDEHLRKLMADNNACKSSGTVTQYDLHQIKKKYYSLAKKIHPDMHPEHAEDENLRKLWDRIVLAYEHNRLKDLEELEFQTERYLETLGEGRGEVTIPDLADKIAKVEAEIDLIKSTDPYLYRLILDDPVSVAEKKKELNDEISSFEEYSAQLDEILKQFDIKRKLS